MAQQHPGAATGIGAADNDTRLALALAAAVRAVGRQLGDDPRRVQAMVVDSLGAQSRALRAEVDAVVLAAEEAIPEQLLADGDDLSGALDSLRARGLDRGTATFAIDVWRYALGMHQDDTAPPSLRNSLERATDPAITDRAEVEWSERSNEFTAAWETDLAEPRSARTDEMLVNEELAVETPTKATRPSRGTLLVGGFAVLAVGLAAVVLIANRGDEQPSAGPSGTAPVAAVPTPPAATFAPSTTVPPATVVFEPQVSDGLTVTRTWSIDDGVLLGTLALANPTNADVTTRYYEVIPKSMAATADLITSEPAHEVVDPDPVIAWTLTVHAGDTANVAYSVDVDDAAGADQLERWKSDWSAPAAAFDQKRAAAPTLAITTPDGSVTAPGPMQITGTVSADATVTANGVVASVSADGTWTATVPGLTPGPNTVTVVATSEFGVETSLAITVTVVEPPPPNQPPVKKFDPTYGGGDCFFWAEPLVLQAFEDPEGDAMSVSEVGAPDVGTAWVGGDGTLIHWEAPAENWSGQAVVAFVVTDGHGNFVPGVLTITVNCV